MLRIAILVLAGALVIGGAAEALAGSAMGIPLFVVGALLTIGTVFEQRRYRPRVRQGASWQRTDERFVDPESGAVMTVYYDPVTGARDYRRE